ncbi:Phospholipid-transporting ATPase 1 [Hordeum vulgare]|nr:Phospholipid-transporting ATPase 1 [Hordeum vulgare]
MQSAFMQDQASLDMDGFPLDHVFPDDYGLEEEDEVDIDGEPLFEDELANQAVEVQLKCKRRRTKAYTTTEDKLLCECWRALCQTPRSAPNKGHQPFGFVSIAFQDLEAFNVQHEGKSFNLSHYWRIIKDEEKFKFQYAVLTTYGGRNQ